MTIKTLGVAATAALLFCAGTGTARADIVAHWNMNDRHQVLHDSAKAPQDGRIGRKIILNGHDQRFTRAPKNTHVRGRIDVVPDNPHLDPGARPFGVTLSFTWTGGSDNNLIQKGQGSPAGGLLKVKTTMTADGQPPGQIKCLFRGSTGDSQVESYGGPRLDDGLWHTVTCRRTATGTVMAVDGAQVDANPNDPGVISNDWPVAIGGNSSCADGVILECNYWQGRIGDIRWFVKHPAT